MFKPFHYFGFQYWAFAAFYWCKLALYYVYIAGMSAYFGFAYLAVTCLYFPGCNITCFNLQVFTAGMCPDIYCSAKAFVMDLSIWNVIVE